MTHRDSKGRFKKCPLRQAKDAIKGAWVSPYKEVVMVILVLWIIITAGIWLFCDKQTIAIATDSYRGYGYNVSSSQWELDDVPYTYAYTEHSRYTIPESISAEYSWFVGICDSFWKWLVSHPVV